LTDATRRLASLDVGNVKLTEHVIARFAMGSRLRHQSRLPGTAMKQVTVHTYRQDTYSPRVVRALAAILARSDVVAPVGAVLGRSDTCGRKTTRRSAAGTWPFWSVSSQQAYPRRLAPGVSSVSTCTT